MSLALKRDRAPSCETAPLVTIYRDGVRRRPVTLVYPYYDNPSTLERHVHRWLAWTGFMPYMRVIIVDDASPETPASDVLRGLTGLSLRLFRIEQDIRWNWIAARNIGMHHAEEGWCVMTDMDHFIPVDTMMTAVGGKLKDGAVYRFSRTEIDGTPIHPHPNSWMLERATFFGPIGGYDETLSGHYGTDGDFRKRVAAAAPVYILTDVLMRDEHNGDSSTRRYLRKQPEDAGVRDIIRARKPGWRPKTLSFPYHEVAL